MVEGVEVMKQGGIAGRNRFSSRSNQVDFEFAATRDLEMSAAEPGIVKALCYTDDS